MRHGAVRTLPLARVILGFGPQNPAGASDYCIGLWQTAPGLILLMRPRPGAYDYMGVHSLASSSPPSPSICRWG
jgi:hypothetical protein